MYFIAQEMKKDCILLSVCADKAAAQKAEAIELGEKLKTTTVTIQTKCGTGGKLFGAVTYFAERISRIQSFL